MVTLFLILLLVGAMALVVNVVLPWVDQERSRRARGGHGAHRLRRP